MNTYWIHLFFCFFCCLVHCIDFSTLSHLKPSVSMDDQEQTVRDLIQRNVGPRASDFSVSVSHEIAVLGKDTFKLQTEGGRLYITGSSGVAAAWGFYYYLSQYCDCHISWAGNQLNLPSQLPPLPPGGINITSNDRFRYYQNVCTVSYSSVWWNWTRWERELDWMAMNGINLPLAFTAQEAIWQRVLLGMGFTHLELMNHFGGAAFLAWSRMGNMHGWGGPLPESWHIHQVALQHRLLARMRAFGMVPVLPAFAGYVPDAVTRIFPSAKVTHMRHWGRFNSPYCCTMLLDVEDPLFVKFGQAFLNEYIAEFGTDHVYNADTFNENQPKSSDPSYLRRAGKAVYDAMLAADPQAVWLMQGWLFVNDDEFWQPANAEALLTSVPLGKMIVLDLYSEVVPQYQRLRSYFGQPFIWCMLHNFGGTLPLYGDIQSVNEGPSKARMLPNSTMIGVGLTMEGINQNNMIYEFMLENSWRPHPRNITQWIQKYTKRRYGTYSLDADRAWQLLKLTVYNCTDGQKHHNKGGFVHRPSRNVSFDVWYSAEDFYKAWDHLILASASFLNSSLFRYDLVDVTREALQLVFMLYYSETVKHYQQQNYMLFKHCSQKMLDLLLNVDKLLATDKHFLLGAWLENAKNMSTSEQEQRLYEYNARNQITLWGPNGNILDYANKQWAGLVQAYYFPRWKLFVDELERQWNVTFDDKLFQNEVFTTVEQPFTFDRTPFPPMPIGDQIEVARDMHLRYRPTVVQHAAFFRSLPNLSIQQHSKYDAKSHQPYSGDWTWKV